MIKIISKNKEKISMVTDMSESLANAIRRFTLEIPILAIDEVEVYKNDSALYDEVLAHRLGLVPLVADKTIKERDKCNCAGKGCGKCSVNLKIQMKGPATVYSKDLKGGAEAVYEGIPITLLNEDQEVELVATARLGKGIDHSKYSPGLSYYRNLAKVEIDNQCDECKKCIEACPQKILGIEKGKAKIKDVYKCDLCEACVEACKKSNRNAIKVEKAPELMFFIESWGQIKAEEIFTRAIDQLNDTLKELSKSLK
ncbi:hypothetical protein A3K73_02300 [Candidatus Pacearchaeota archaeon RBG_13_36_9]|nr:MAG: hypothetical protein A3K73_02300 [Candidatus Pacearchaeota archaeon RBG_13_36_9]